MQIQFGIDLSSLGQIGLAFLILSTVVEVALAPIFNWRVYLARFEGTSYINPVVFIFTYLLVRSYNLDIAAVLLQALTPAFSAFAGSDLVSSFMLMAGSQAVFRTFNWMGIRNLDARKRKAMIARISKAIE